MRKIINVRIEKQKNLFIIQFEDRVNNISTIDKIKSIFINRGCKNCWRNSNAKFSTFNEAIDYLDRLNAMNNIHVYYLYHQSPNNLNRKENEKPR